MACYSGQLLRTYATQWTNQTQSKRGCEASHHCFLFVWLVVFWLTNNFSGRSRPWTRGGGGGGGGVLLTLPAFLSSVVKLLAKIRGDLGPSPRSASEFALDIFFYFYLSLSFIVLIQNPEANQNYFRHSNEDTLVHGYSILIIALLSRIDFHNTKCFVQGSVWTAVVLGRIWYMRGHRWFL